MPGTTAPPAETSAPDKFAWLKELGDLWDSGVLTEDEFELERGELLAT